MFLSFNNGKKIDLSMLKEGIEIKNDNFFKNYDKNKNSIFDAEEIAQIQEDLMNAAGDDAVLSEKEALSFYAKIMNKTIKQVEKLFKKEENTNTYSAIEQLFVDQAENDAKAKMQADVDNAIDIFNQAQGGVISKGCNNLKELFNTQYAGDKVYRQIMNKQVSTWLLEEADSSDELTKKEYIEKKVQLLLFLMNIEGLTGKEIDSIYTGLLKSTEKELQKFLDRLVNAENDEYSQVVEQTLTELNQKAYTLNELDKTFKGINPKSLEAILNGKEGEKKLDFKTAFQFENGIEFDEEKILNAKNKAQIASINLSVSTKINSMREHLKNSALDVNLALSQPSVSENIKEQKYNQLSDAILNTLKAWLGNDEEKITEAIKTYGNSTAKIKDGKIVFETNLTGKAGNSAEMLVALANDVSNAMFESLDKFLGEKTIEEYLAEAELANKDAYGNKNPIDIAEKFQESQYKMLGGVKFAVMGTAGLVGAMSSGLLIPVLSSIVGSGLSLGISALDAATDEKGYTAEDREAIKQELKMNAIYLPTGMAIGGVSSALVGNLTKCTGFLRLLAEAGPDAAMSLLADLAITGEIDLKGEGLAQLMNIALGVIAGAKVHKTGANNPKPPKNEKTPEFNYPKKQKTNFTPEEFTKKYNKISGLINNHKSNFDKQEVIEVLKKEILGENSNLNQHEIYERLTTFYDLNQRISIDEIYKLIKKSDEKELTECLNFVNETLKTPEYKDIYVSQDVLTDIYRKFKYGRSIEEGGIPNDLYEIFFKNENTRLKYGVSDEHINNLSLLITKPEDWDLVRYIMNIKPSKFKRAGAKVFNVDTPPFITSDIICFMQNAEIKSFIQEAMNNGKKLNRSDVIKFIKKNNITLYPKEMFNEKVDLSYKTQDIRYDTTENIETLYKTNITFKNLINSKVPAGEVAQINGTLYCNNGKELVRINMSKEMFEKLFPIQERYNIKQGTLGDCWFLTGIARLMDTPIGRANIYKMFKQDGDDLIVEFPQKNTKIRFKNSEINKLSALSLTKREGKLKIGKKSDSVIASDGVKTLEQAFALLRNYDGNEAEIVVNDILMMNRKMQNLDGGFSSEIIKAICPDHNFNILSKPDRTNPAEVENFFTALGENLKNENIILTFASNGTQVSNITNIIGQHAYSIVGYDLNSKTIQIVNPWDANIIQSIPRESFLDMLEKEVRCFSLDKDTKIKVNKTIYQGFLL